MRPRWLRLVLECGEYNPRVRALAHERSGAYAIRERDSHRVMYVGESSCGKLWRTMLRHFQAPESFAKVRETGVFRRGPKGYEVAIWPTSRGVRRCTRQGPGKNEPGDQKALEAQATWIERLRPELNADDGLAEDDSFEFGANARDEEPANAFADLVGNPAPRVVVDAPIERRAENRTPDLWTGRTKLEDREGKQRRDWKGEVERLARELAECRRPVPVPVVVDAASLAAVPMARPEGYGETDERGQARMFRRNPHDPEYPNAIRAVSGRYALQQSADEWVIIDRAAENPRDVVAVVGLQQWPDPALAPWVFAVIAGKKPAGAPPIVLERGPFEVVNPVTEKKTGSPSSWELRSVSFRDGVAPYDRPYVIGWFRSLSVAELVAERANASTTKAPAAKRSTKASAPPAKKPAGYGEEVTTGKRAGQIKLFNPRGALTNLGALTELVGRDAKTKKPRVMRWPITKAPTLAYDDAGRLFIVYGSKVERSTTAKETTEYKRTHWGKRGRGVVTTGGVAVPPFRRVMVGESITYTTEKGSDFGPVDYIHAWGEGARGKWLPPIVVEHECHPETCPRGSRCAARGSVALMGGTYKVNDRGIVG